MQNLTLTAIKSLSYCVHARQLAQCNGFLIAYLYICASEPGVVAAEHAALK